MTVTNYHKLSTVLVTLYSAKTRYLMHDSLQDVWFRSQMMERYKQSGGLGGTLVED